MDDKEIFSEVLASFQRKYPRRAIGVEKDFNCENEYVSIDGQRKFCITGYNGLDPDVNTAPTTGGFPTPGYDYLAYPKARTFTFGLNVAF